jgi:hypothetical protein
MSLTDSEEEHLTDTLVTLTDIITAGDVEGGFKQKLILRLADPDDNLLKALHSLSHELREFTRHGLRQAA